MRTATLNILGSSAISQLLMVASTPVLTRHYDQEQFGWFGVATTVSLLISTCLTLRLEHSIHVTKQSPSQLFSACLLLISILAIAVALPLALLAPDALIDNRGDLALIIVFSIAHATFVCGLINLNFHQRFRSIAGLNLVVPIMFIIGAVWLHDINLGVNQLLFWQAIAYSVGAFIAIAMQRAYIIKVSLSALKNVLIEEQQNIRYLVPSSMLSILSLNLSVIGATLLFDSAIAGLVVIAQRVARAPIGVIGNSLNEVLRSSIPKRDQIYTTFSTISFACSGVAAIMIFSVLAVPESLFTWIFGNQWLGIKQVLVITTAGACFQLIATSVFCLLTSFNKKADMQINFALVISGIAALGFSYLLSLDAYAYLWIHTVLTAIAYMLGYTIAYRVARKESGTVDYQQSE